MGPVVAVGADQARPGRREVPPFVGADAFPRLLPHARLRGGGQEARGQHARHQRRVGCRQRRLRTVHGGRRADALGPAAHRARRDRNGQRGGNRACVPIHAAKVLHGRENLPDRTNLHTGTVPFVHAMPACQEVPRTAPVKSRNRAFSPGVSTASTRWTLFSPPGPRRAVMTTGGSFSPWPRAPWRGSRRTGWGRVTSCAAGSTSRRRRPAIGASSSPGPSAPPARCLSPGWSSRPPRPTASVRCSSMPSVRRGKAASGTAA